MMDVTKVLIEWGHYRSVTLVSTVTLGERRRSNLRGTDDKHEQHADFLC
jgi:hypothetical protein